MKKKLFIFVILCLLVGVTLVPTMRAATLTSNWASQTPTIDGTIASGEWNDANATSFSAYDSFYKISLTVYLWAKNNGNTLFLRLQWVDDTINNLADILKIFFDGNGGYDGSWAGLENSFACELNSTIFNWADCHAGSLDSGPQDGSAARSYNALGHTYTVEIAMPIGSADAEDIQSGAGSLIGIAFQIASVLPTDYYSYCYPTGAWINHTVVTFQLAAAPSSIGTPIIMITLLSMIFLIALFDIRRKSFKLPV